MNYSIADRFHHSQTMLAGLEANAERLAKRGLDGKFLTDYSQQFQSAIALDNEHEAAKARLKEKTAAFHGQLDQVDLLYREAKKLVKLELPQASWKEFGVYDQR